MEDRSLPSTSCTTCTTFFFYPCFIHAAGLSALRTLDALSNVRLGNSELSSTASRKNLNRFSELDRRDHLDGSPNPCFPVRAPSLKLSETLKTLMSCDCWENHAWSRMITRAGDCPWRIRGMGLAKFRRILRISQSRFMSLQRLRKSWRTDLCFLHFDKWRLDSF